MPRAAATTALAVTLVTGLLGLAPAGAAAQAPAAPEPTTLTVTGTGTVQVRPDTATVGVLVRRTSRNGERSRAFVNRRTARIVAALVRLGLPRADVQTSGISLEQLRGQPRRKGGPRPLLFVAANRLTIHTTRLELVGDLFDVATRAGATEFSGPNFTVANRTPGRADATTAAVADARTRAEAAAAALGLRIVGVRSVNLDPGDSEDVYPTSTSSGSSEVGAPATPTPVRPGTEEVDARVSVVFLLGP